MLILWSRPIYDIFFREWVEGPRYVRFGATSRPGEKAALTPDSVNDR